MNLFRKYNTESAQETAGPIEIAETNLAPLLRLLKVAISQLSRRTLRRRNCHLSAGYITVTSINSATLTAIKWDRRGLFDAESYAHDTDARATKVFILETGVHTVHAQVVAIGTGIGGGSLFGEVWKNGVAVPLGIFQLLYDGAGNWAGSISIPVHFMAGDYLEVKVADYNGATSDAEVDNGGATYITITREL